MPNAHQEHLAGQDTSGSSDLLLTADCPSELICHVARVLRSLLS